MTLRTILVGLFACVLLACSSEPPADARLAAGSNAAFSHEVTTAAPPAAVWRLWTDVATWSSWDKGLKDARASGPLALGVTGTIVPLSGPEASFTITAFDAGRSYAFQTDLPLASLIVKRTIIAENPTRFRHDVRFSGPLGGLWAWQFGPGFRAALPPTMEAIAAQAEGLAP